MSFFGFGAKKPQYMTYEQQVAALKADQQNVRPSDSPRTFDIGLLVQGIPQPLRVRILLPEGFPETAGPQMFIMDRRCTHPWLDGMGRIVGSPQLNGWTAADNLGTVVRQVLSYLAAHPPVIPVALAGPGGVGYQQQPQTPPPGAATAGSGMRPPMMAGGTSAASYPVMGTVGDAGMGGLPATPMGSGGPAATGAFGRPYLANSLSLGSGGAAAVAPAPGPAPAPAGPPAFPSVAVAAPRSRQRTLAPAVPTSFPALQGYSLAELQTLMEDAEARAQFLWGVDERAAFAELAAATRQAITEAAQRNTESATALAASKAQFEAAQAESSRLAAHLQALQKRQQAVIDRYAPLKLAKEFDLIADEADSASSLVKDGALSEDNAERFGTGSSTGGGGMGESVVSGPTVAPAVREFRDEYLPLRRRHHAAAMKAASLRDTAARGLSLVSG